jgi:copper homeostasis protein
LRNQSAISNQQSKIFLPLLLLEVIVQTVDDARAAADGGADRLEVVRSIRDGGLTPAPSLVEAIAAATRLPLRVMVRENAGYESSPVEWHVLRRAAGDIASIGVDGLVTGFARGGNLLLGSLSVVLDAAPGVPVTFHRAFETLTDPMGAVDVLAGIQRIDRILTSGGEGTAVARCARLRELSARAAGRLVIIAGGGVDEEAFAAFAKDGCVREIHVGRAAREGLDPEGPVSAARVRRLRDLADA